MMIRLSAGQGVKTLTSRQKVRSCISEMLPAAIDQNIKNTMGIDLSQQDVAIVATPPKPVASQTHEKGALYHFYDVRDKNGKQVKDFPDYYSILISQAKQSIRIWDPYFHEIDDCKLFSGVTANKIEIKIVTSLDHNPNRPQDKQTVDDYSKYIERNLPKSVAAAEIAIRAYSHNDWHDRFLIIDDRYFLVGASVYNQLNNNLSHGIYEVINPKDKDLILRKFNQYYTSTKDSYKITIHRPKPENQSKRKRRHG